MFTKRTNIATGLAFLALFVLLGFAFIFMRDFSPGRAQGVADYAVGKHFESPLSYVHGNLFAPITIAVGLVLLGLPLAAGMKRRASGIGLAGMLRPTGILTGLLFDVPPHIVFVGGLSMVAAIAWPGPAVSRTEAVR